MSRSAEFECVESCLNPTDPTVECLDLCPQEAMTSLCEYSCSPVCFSACAEAINTKECVESCLNPTDPTDPECLVDSCSETPIPTECRDLCVTWECLDSCFNSCSVEAPENQLLAVGVTGDSFQQSSGTASATPPHLAGQIILSIIAFKALNGTLSRLGSSVWHGLSLAGELIAEGYNCTSNIVTQGNNCVSNLYTTLRSTQGANNNDNQTSAKKAHNLKLKAA